MSRRRLRLQVLVGAAALAWALFIPPALAAAGLLEQPERTMRLRVCFLSTTEEPSCATIAESYSPPPSPPSPPSP